MDWSNLFSGVGALAAAGSAFFAGIQIYNSNKMQRMTLDSERPIFSLSPGGVSVGKNNLKEKFFKMFIAALNQGKRPAKNLTFRTIVIEKSTGRIFFDYESTFFPMVIQNTGITWDSPPWSVDIHPLSECYIFFGIKYDDSIGTKHFRQQYHLRWEGMKNGDPVGTIYADDINKIESINTKIKEMSPNYFN